MPSCPSPAGICPCLQLGSQPRSGGLEPLCYWSPQDGTSPCSRMDGTLCPGAGRDLGQDLPPLLLRWWLLGHGMLVLAPSLCQLCSALGVVPLGGFPCVKGCAPKLGDLSAAAWGRRAGLPAPRHPKQWWLSHGKHPEPLPLLLMHTGHHLRPGQSLAWGTSSHWEHPCLGNVSALRTSLPSLCLGAALLCRLLPTLPQQGRCW